MSRSDPLPDDLAGLHFGAREGAVVSNAARRSVSSHLHERFGTRDPHSGWILRVVFILLLLSALRIGMLNGDRLGIEHTVIPGAIVSLAVGAGVLTAVAAAGRMPLGRPVALQSTVLAILLTVAAAAAGATTDGWVRMAYLAGAALAAIAAVAVHLGRAHGRSLTTEIDSAVELAHLDVTAEVAAALERLTADLARDLAGRVDVAEMARRRGAAIAALRSHGAARMDADEPDTLPGAFIVREQTMLWLPLSQRRSESS